MSRWCGGRDGKENSRHGMPMERRWPTYENGIPPASDAMLGIRSSKVSPREKDRRHRGAPRQRHKCPECGNIVVGAAKFGACRICATRRFDDPIPAVYGEDDDTVEWMPTLLQVMVACRSIRVRGYTSRGVYHSPWTERECRVRHGEDIEPVEFDIENAIPFGIVDSPLLYSRNFSDITQFNSQH